MVKYKNTQWTDGSGEPINANNLNNIEQGIVNLCNEINNLSVPEVVQTTGNSTTAVMSQKAATDKFATKVEIDDIKTAIVGVDELVGSGVME